MKEAVFETVWELRKNDYAEVTDRSEECSDTVREHTLAYILAHASLRTTAS